MAKYPDDFKLLNQGLLWNAFPVGKEKQKFQYKSSEEVEPLPSYFEGVDRWLPLCGIALKCVV